MSRHLTPEEMQQRQDERREQMTWVRSVGDVFAEQMRRRRTEVGLSQGYLAAQMVFSYGHPSWVQSTVAKTERGERAVKLTEAVAIADALGVDLAELIGSRVQREGAGDGEHREET